MSRRRSLETNNVLLEGTKVGDLSSPEKVLFLLKRLGEPPYEMGVTELAREMCAAKSGVHKLLALLVRESFLVQNGATRRYSLGPAVFRLGNVYSDMKGIGEVARGVMEAIATITGTSVFVGIREGDEAYLAYKVDSPEGFIYQGQVGRRFPIHAGALGKLLTAYRDPEKVRVLLAGRTLERRAPRTITDPERMLEEYARIREQGYAVSDEENSPGAYGLAAPIRDRNGDVWACLCIAGPKRQFHEEQRSNWLRLVVNGAEEISYRLGFRS